MDWSHARFEEITVKLGAFLIQAGFRKSRLHFVPVSGLTGENLITQTDGCPLYEWYKGQTLLDHIGQLQLDISCLFRFYLTECSRFTDRFEPPVRLLDKPFRMAVSDFFKGGIGSSSGVSVAGRIDAGHVQVGEQVVAIPGGEMGIVKSKIRF
jgi:elongation factor 1 alpha-like protein